MKNANQVYSDIIKRFKSKVKKEIQEGTVIDFYTVSTSEAFEDAYQEIENNKNPHIFTKLKEKDLDDTGFFLKCPREPQENDDTYKYRLMNWVLRNEASNTTAIEDSLLNLDFASTAKYIPFSNGTSTATIYIIPKSYDEEDAKLALREVEEKIKGVVSPSMYVELIIPEAIKVSVHAVIRSKDGDMNFIKDNIEGKIKEYINSIPPKEHMQIGALTRIGINEPSVDFFNILQVFIDEEELRDVSVLQGIETKLIFDEMIWTQ